MGRKFYFKLSLNSYDYFIDKDSEFVDKISLNIMENE